MPRPALAHGGQHRRCHFNQAEYICLEDGANLVCFALLHCGQTSVSRVVDENIHPSKALLCLRDGRMNLSWLRDVQCDSKCSFRVGFNQVRNLTPVPCRDYGALAAGKYQLGQLSSKPR